MSANFPACPYGHAICSDHNPACVKLGLDHKWFGIMIQYSSHHLVPIVTIAARVIPVVSTTNVFQSIAQTTKSIARELRNVSSTKLILGIAESVELNVQQARLVKTLFQTFYHQMYYRLRFVVAVSAVLARCVMMTNSNVRLMCQCAATMTKSARRCAFFLRYIFARPYY